MNLAKHIRNILVTFMCHYMPMQITKKERRKRLESLNRLVQMGLVRVVRIVDGEPCYLITGDVEREPPAEFSGRPPFEPA